MLRAKWSGFASQSNLVETASNQTLPSPMLLTPGISTTRLKGRKLGTTISVALASSFQRTHPSVAITIRYDQYFVIRHEMLRAVVHSRSPAYLLI
ncbi:hypothetical protein REPUB_Repub17cG0128700 [Reevesia pubescens]